MIKDYIFDFVFVCFSDLKTDARSINLIKLLQSQNKRIAVFSLADNGAYIEEANLLHFYIQKSNHSKSYRRWYDFLLKTKEFLPILNAKNVVAADLYALAFAAKLAAKCKAKLFYDSREIYSALGPLAGHSIKQKIITTLEKYLIRNVDEFIVSGDLDANYLIRHFKTDKKFHVIYNLPFYKPLHEKHLIKEKYPEWQNKTILLYQGAVLKGRGIKPIIDAIADSDEYVFAVIGDGEYLDYYKNYVKQLNLEDKIKFLGSIDYSNLHDWTCSADIGICLIEPISFSYEMALPNKLFEFINAGLPVLANELPAIKELADKYNFGLIVNKQADTKEIILALEQIKNRYEYFKRQAIEAAKDFNYEKQSNKILKIFGL